MDAISWHRGKCLTSLIFVKDISLIETISRGNTMLFDIMPSFYPTNRCWKFSIDVGKTDAKHFLRIIVREKYLTKFQNTVKVLVFADSNFSGNIFLYIFEELNFHVYFVYRSDAKIWIFAIKSCPLFEFWINCILANRMMWGRTG